LSDEAVGGAAFALQRGAASRGDLATRPNRLFRALRNTQHCVLLTSRIEVRLAPKSGEQNMTESNFTVAVYDTHTAAEDAIKALRDSGYDMKNLSIIGKDYQTEEHAIGFYNTEDRMKYWGKTGAFWGGLWGWLIGAGFFLIPGIGHLIVLGPALGWIVGAIEGATVGAGAGVLAAALAGAGIPKDSVVKYETAIRGGKFVVAVHGVSAELDRARTILAGKGTADVATYASPAP
jgi:hypothetical protein